MYIGTAIQTLRKYRKISQEELAKKCGLSQTSISQIETNVHRPHYHHLFKICKYLKISIGGLYIMALTEKDVPKQKRKLFRSIQGIIKDIFIQN